MKAKHWQPNGKVCSMTNLVDGNGEIVNYFLNGKKSLIESFKNGELNGTVVKYYESGVVMSKAILTKGLERVRKFLS